MYHNNPATALEELQEEGILPNPVHVRDMIIRAHLSPGDAMELNRRFQEYLHAFSEAQSIGRGIMEQLAALAVKGA
jgi:hypothetical protein